MQQRLVGNSVMKTVVAAVILSGTAILKSHAQTNSINAFSPYSMFGIGELSTQGTLPMRSMGGVGIAWRSSSMTSLLNPAGYSATMRKSFIFNFGVEGMNIVNSQNKYDTSGNKTGMAKNAKNSVNFHDIALQMPLAKGLGLGLSLTPYSSVGYNMTTTEQSDDIWGQIGRVQYNYTGEGDITEVKLGIGWEIFKNFSLGVAGMYYWGDIDRDYTAFVKNDIVGVGNYSSTIGTDNYSVSSFKFQAGLQYNIIANDKRMLTVGATYDLGGSLRPKLTRSIYNDDINSTTVTYENSSSQIRLPEQWAAGVFYQDARIAVGFDYVYQNWGGRNSKISEQIYGGYTVSYVNTSTFKVGIEYTPNRFDVRHYYNRMAYRLGFRYGGYYQSYQGEKIDQYAITAGFGFPIRFLGASAIDFGVEFGGRGSLKSVNSSISNAKIGLIKQQYIKFAIGLTMFGEDYWFVRPKYD